MITPATLDANELVALALDAAGEIYDAAIDRVEGGDYALQDAELAGARAVIQAILSAHGTSALEAIRLAGFPR